jgi:hypothetical protein
MIPLSTREAVTFKDSDGIEWRFIPKYGEYEREIMGIPEAAGSMTLVQQCDKTDEIINRILLGWSGGPANMPKYPDDKKPSRLFSQSEKAVIIGMWNDANRLTAEEKKL